MLLWREWNISPPPKVHSWQIEYIHRRVVGGTSLPRIEARSGCNQVNKGVGTRNACPLVYISTSIAKIQNWIALTEPQWDPECQGACGCGSYPLQWPNLGRGKAAYNQVCAQWTCKSLWCRRLLRVCRSEVHPPRVIMQEAPSILNRGNMLIR